MSIGKPEIDCPWCSAVGHEPLQHDVGCKYYYQRTTPHASPRLPIQSRRNRLYDAGGREVLVATRSDPSLRGRADQTAAETAMAINAHDDAIALARRLIDEIDCGDFDGGVSQATYNAARAFLAKVGA